MCVPAASQSSWLIVLCTPSTSWLHPSHGAELELPHLSVLDDLVPPNQPGCCPPDCFNPGRIYAKSVLVLRLCLRSSGRSQTPAAGCRPSVAHRQLGCVEEASRGKVLVCKSAIPNPIPLGFCPGSQFYHLLLSRASLSRPRCRRQQDGVELDFVFFFFQIRIAKSRTS